jgi:hypothetical protein
MTLMTENQMTGMKEKKYQTLKQQSLMTGECSCSWLSVL